MKSSITKAAGIVQATGILVMTMSFERGAFAGDPVLGGYISDMEVREVVLHVADHQIHALSDGEYSQEWIQSKTARVPEGIEWGYPWGVTLLGMERANEAIGDKEADQFVVEHNLICGRYYHWLAGLESQAGGDGRRFARSTKIRGLMTLGNLDNCGAMGSEMIESMMNHPKEISSEEQEVIARITDWIVHKQDRLPDGTFWRPQRMGGTVWPDDLYMGGEYLAQDGIYSHHPKLIDDAAEQIIHQANLEQDNDGLWFHGYFVAEKKHLPFKWGRGNGWAIVATVDILSVMANDDPLRPKLMGILRKQIAGLEKVQAPDGMWRQVLDRPDLWEETSCSAMFAYGIARAVNRGWIEPGNMRVARRAFAAIAKNVSADGTVHGTCEGTNISTDLNYYIQRRRPDDDPHGWGPVMLAGAEILSADKK